MAQGSGYLTIGASLPIGDFLQKLPYLALEDGAPKVQGYAELMQLSREVSVKLGSSLKVMAIPILYQNVLFFPSGKASLKAPLCGHADNSTLRAS
jgi:hypothetical protein